MTKFKKLITSFGTALCALCLCIAPVYADTDGTELQVTEASMLEIQLGADWVGVEFQLKTDVGMYPDTISVGDDGVLRLEIGGSSTYTLSCLNSSVAVPEAPTEGTEVEVQPTETPVSDEEPDKEPDAEQNTSEQPDPETPDAPEAESEPDDGTVAGIPIKHIVIFGGGLLLAVGGLIAIKVVSKRREEHDEYDDDDYEDEE